MNKLRTDERMYILELFLLFGISTCIMLEMTTLVSGLFQLTFILLVLAIVIQLWIHPVLNKLHVLAALTVMFSVIHVLLQTSSLSFDYYKKLIMFACTVLMIPFVDFAPASRRVVRWILGLNMLIAATYPFMYWVVGVRGYMDIYLTMNFSNPNATGMFLLHSVLYCAIAFYYFRHWLLKGISLVLVVLLLVLNEKTGCRSTLVAMIAFGAFVAVNVVLKKEIRISKGISFLLVIFPLVFVFVYMAMAGNEALEQHLDFLIGRGKNLHSRVDMWRNALEAYRRSPIIGAYDVISGGSGSSQMHNTHLDVLTSYGTVPFVLFIALLHQGVAKILSSATTSFTRMSLFAFYAILIQGSFEAALVSGGTGLYILSFGFLILAKSNQDRVVRQPIPKAEPGEIYP